MTATKPSADAILDGFLAAYRQDRAALGTYCLKYPEKTSELVELAYELALQETLAGDAPLDKTAEGWIAAELGASGPVGDPFATLNQTGFAKLRETMGVPTPVLNAFRNRLVAGGTVPLAFLERLADELGTELRSLANHLAGPPRLGKAASFKADGAPGAPATKLSFAELLDEVGVPADTRIRLLDEDN